MSLEEFITVVIGYVAGYITRKIRGHFLKGRE